MKRRASRAFARPMGRIAVGAVVLAVQMWPLATASAAGARAGEPETTLMDVSILVDESGSLNDADVTEWARKTADLTGTQGRALRRFEQ